MAGCVYGSVLSLTDVDMYGDLCEQHAPSRSPRNICFLARAGAPGGRLRSCTCARAQTVVENESETDQKASVGSRQVKNQIKEMRQSQR